MLDGHIQALSLTGYPANLSLPHNMHTKEAYWVSHRIAGAHEVVKCVGVLVADTDGFAWERTRTHLDLHTHATHNDATIHRCSPRMAETFLSMTEVRRTRTTIASREPQAEGILGPRLWHQ